MAHDTREIPKRRRDPLALAGQAMTEYALILAGLALVAYGLTPTEGYNFVDDCIMVVIKKVISLL